MEIKQGYKIKSLSGDWHTVLKVEGEGYVQSTNGMSIQSRNEGKSKTIVHIYDGLFLNKRSLEEVEKLYVEVNKTITSSYAEEMSKFLCGQLYALNTNPAYLKCNNYEHENCDCKEVYGENLSSEDGSLEKYLADKIYEFIG